MIEVLGFGECSIDHVHVVAELPRPGLAKLRIESHFSACGGQVATTMAACAALGLRASYAGPVGNDQNGRTVQEALRGRRVDLSRLIVREAATRFAVILVARHGGERVVLWDRDPRLDLDEREIDGEMHADAAVVHVDAVDESASIGVARRAREAGAIVTCDIDAVTAGTPELLSHVTMPVLAEHVPAALTGISDTEAALRALRRTHDGVLVVTLGERGAAALDGNRFVHAPAAAVVAVDTTGAGDVFRAGFIYGALRRWPIERALGFANAAAAVSCTRAGAMEGIPTVSDVLAILPAS